MSGMLLQILKWVKYYSHSWLIMKKKVIYFLLKISAQLHFHWLHLHFCVSWWFSDNFSPNFVGILNWDQHMKPAKHQRVSVIIVSMLVFNCCLSFTLTMLLISKCYHGNALQEKKKLKIKQVNTSMLESQHASILI